MSDSGRATIRLCNVVAMLDVVVQDIPFSRSRWPRHVTVSGNFETDLGLDSLGTLIATIARAHRPFTASSGIGADFGANGDIPVVLAEPKSRWMELHEALRGRLVATGVTFATPNVGDQYRPHVTDTDAGPWSGSVRVMSLALAVIDSTRATLVSNSPLVSEGQEPTRLAVAP